MLLFEAAWWVVAVATFGVGDAVTTIAGTRRAGLVERSPVVRRVAGREPSVPALVGLKLVAFGIALGTTYWLPTGTYRLLVPVGLAVLGTAVTAFNCWAIVVHGGPVGADAVSPEGVATPEEDAEEPIREPTDDEAIR